MLDLGGRYWYGQICVRCAGQEAFWKAMRIILFTGKGGVGKTSVAAATGIVAARRGYRTIVMSLDLAHSLSDAFDMDRRLVDVAGGQPVKVMENLWIQELDVQQEIRTYWGKIHLYIAELLNTSGLDEIVSEEIAHLPGMSEVIGLFYVNRYFKEEAFDLVILDCAPTGESLRFLSMPTSLEWYMNRVFGLQRGMAKLARPVASLLYDVPLPRDEYFEAVRTIYKRLDGIQELLEDPRTTSARLVTNPEKMVVRESQRAFMYLCLYGVNVDMVVVNRLYSDEVSDAYFAGWKRTQNRYLKEIEESFAPVPVRKVELFRDQLLGIEDLEMLGRCIYGDEDPASLFFAEPPYRFAKEDGVYRVYMKLPFAGKQDIELSRSEGQLIVRVGTFQRYVALPQSMMSLEPDGAHMEGNVLCVSFGGESDVSRKDRRGRTGR